MNTVPQKPAMPSGPAKAKVLTAAEKRKRLIGYIAGFIFMFILPEVCPTWSTITEMGLKMLGVFIGTMVIFMTSADMVLGSMLACVACLWHGYLTADDIYVGILGNSTSFQILLLLCWGMLMKETDAMQTLGRKLIRGSGKLKKYPVLFNIIFMEAMLFCGMFSNAIVFVVTVLPMFEGIAQAVGYKKEDMYYRVMVTGIIMMGCCLGSAKGVGGLALGVIKVITKQASGYFPFEHNVLQFNLTVRITMVLFAIIVVLLAKFVFKCDFSKLSEADVDAIPQLSKENCKLSKGAKFVLIGFVIIMGRAYLPNPFPESWKIHDFYTDMALPFVVMILLIVFSFFSNPDGTCVIDVKKSFSRVNWDVIWSIGIMTLVAGAITDNELGIRPWLIKIMNPIFGGHSYIVFCFLILLFTCILTNLMSNLGTAVIMGTIACSFMETYVLEQGINPLPLIASVIGVAMIPILTPAAGPIAPIYLARPEMDKKFVYSTGAVMMLVSVILFTVMSVVFGQVMTNPALLAQ